MFPQCVITSNPKCVSYLVGIFGTNVESTSLHGSRGLVCRSCHCVRFSQRQRNSIWSSTSSILQWGGSDRDGRIRGSTDKKKTLNFMVNIRRNFIRVKKVMFQQKGTQADHLDIGRKVTLGEPTSETFAHIPSSHVKKMESNLGSIFLVHSTGQDGEQADSGSKGRRDHSPEQEYQTLSPDENCSSNFSASHHYMFHSNFYNSNGYHLSTEELPNVSSEVLPYFYVDLSPKLGYLSPADRVCILTALQMAYEAHKGQFRKSGEPFIVHPIAVAAILAELKLDRDTIISGLLHDTVEDTSAIEKAFGKDVRRIVEGETKFSKLTSTLGASLDERGQEWSFSDLDSSRGTSSKMLQTCSSAENKQCEYLKHIFIAMTEDVRVILVKLADRLHNIRTLQFMSPEKQRKIARETLEIFAPLAHRLGLEGIRTELEDISFRFYFPQEFVHLSRQLRTFKSNNKVDLCLNQAIVCLKQLLEQDFVLNPLIKRLEIESNTKSFYSLYKKLQSGATLDSIYDLASIRIVIELKQEIVEEWKHEERSCACKQRDPTAQWNWLEILKSSESLEEDFAQISTASLYERNVCYHILGSIHSLWKPIPGKMKDYIAFPKPNGYQSLHTVVLFYSEYVSLPLEIQIRTQTMHEIAELGITCRSFLDSHVEGEKSRIDWRRRTIAWLKSLRDYCDEFSYSSIDLIDAVRKDLLGHRIFVFTPKGYVLDLPKGSTPIDAAYHIHSDVGHNMIGARVNGRFVRLDHVLQNADIIKIIKSDTATGPSPEWIHIARSRTARQKIRRYFRQKEKAELIQKGKQELEQLCREMDVRPPSPSELLNGIQKLLHLLKKRITLRPKSSNASSALVQYLESLRSCDEFYNLIGKISESSNEDTRMDWFRLILRFLRIRKREGVYIEREYGEANIVSKDQTNALKSTLRQQHMSMASQQRITSKPNILVASCCLPVVGDSVVGVVTERNTLVVHRKNCSLVDSSRLFHLDWKNLSGYPPVTTSETNSLLSNRCLLPTWLVIKAKDTVGVLSMIAGVISERGYSITRSASSCEAKTGAATLFFEILVSHVNEIVSITTSLKRCKGVFEVQRVNEVRCLEWCKFNTLSNRLLPAELVELPDDIWNLSL